MLCACMTMHGIHRNNRYCVLGNEPCRQFLLALALIYRSAILNLRKEWHAVQRYKNEIIIQNSVQYTFIYCENIRKKNSKYVFVLFLFIYSILLAFTSGQVIFTVMKFTILLVICLKFNSFMVQLQ